MEKWEKRYLHEKAVRDGLLCSAGMPPITGERYGTFKPVSVLHDCGGKYNGKLFWESMKKDGHSSAEFESCCCNTH